MTPFRNILCATDLSENSVPAIREAAALVRSAASGSITLLYVLPATAVPTFPGLGPTPVAADVSHIDIAARELAEKDLDRLGRKELAGLDWTARLERGAPARTIIRIADKVDADLIVLGTHGRSGLSHALMGSVAEAVTRTASRPVLAARARRKSRRAPVGSA